jgi:hypothetical protein
MVKRIPNPLDLECQKGNAVFCSPSIYTFKIEKAIAESKNMITNYLQRVAKLNDDRLLVLIADLLIENAVDDYLSAIIPMYEKLQANESLHTRIAIAKGLKLSPSKFFDGADIVRQIRNKFVHQLEIESFEAFEKLKPKLVHKMEAMLRTYFPRRPLAKGPLREAFKSLALYTLVGINTYVPNIRSLNSFLRDDAFLESLVNFLNEKEVRQNAELK